MSRYAQMVADLKMARATITQQNVCITELVAIVHDLAPNHEILKRLPFLQYVEPTDTDRESR